MLNEKCPGTELLWILWLIQKCEVTGRPDSDGHSNSEGGSTAPERCLIPKTTKLEEQNIPAHPEKERRQGWINGIWSKTGWRKGWSASTNLDNIERNKTDAQAVRQTTLAALRLCQCWKTNKVWSEECLEGISSSSVAPSVFSLSS